MAKRQPQDLADRTIDGTYPSELRDMAHLARIAWETQSDADAIEREAYDRHDESWPELRQIAAMAYAVWRKIETTCQPIVEAFEREQDTVRQTEDVYCEGCGWQGDRFAATPVFDLCPQCGLPDLKAFQEAK